MKTRWRRLIIILTAVLFVGGMIGFQILSKQKAPPPRNASTGPVSLQLDAGLIKLDALAVPVPIQGRIAAYEKIDIYAEVNGLAAAAAHPFKEGVRFKKGETLVQLDDREARLALQGQRAALLTTLAQILPDLRIEFPENFSVWQNYVDKLDPEKTIQDLPKPKSEREKYFLASRNIQTQYYTIRSAEERLSKYRIIAPFEGAITTVDIQTGALVRPGQRIGQFLRTGTYELESTVSLGDLQFVKPGQTVKLTSEDTGQEYTGTIRRIGEQIEQSTQMLPVYIEVSGPNLKEGMFLSGSVKGTMEQGVFALPKDLLINGRSIWTIRDSSLVKADVDLVRSARDVALIKGIAEGTLFVRKVIPGMYEGQKITYTIE